MVCGSINERFFREPSPRNKHFERIYFYRSTNNNFKLWVHRVFHSSLVRTDSNYLEDHWYSAGAKKVSNKWF